MSGEVGYPEEESDYSWSMYEHSERTGHTVTLSIDKPWRCMDCSARSVMYRVERKVIDVELPEPFDTTGKGS